MARLDKDTLKSYFESGDKPTQEQFASLIDSMGLANDVEQNAEKIEQQGNKLTELESETNGLILALDIQFNKSNASEKKLTFV